MPGFAAAVGDAAVVDEVEIEVDGGDAAVGVNAHVRKFFFDRRLAGADEFDEALVGRGIGALCIGMLLAHAGVAVVAQDGQPAVIHGQEQGAQRCRVLGDDEVLELLHQPGDLLVGLALLGRRELGRVGAVREDEQDNTGDGLFHGMFQVVVG